MMSGSLCVDGSLLGSEGHQDCEDCYHISVTALVGIVVSDIVLTIFIVIAVFCFATQHRKKKESETLNGKRSLMLYSSRKMPKEVTESPYQELQGGRSDVYSELPHFKKSCK